MPAPTPSRFDGNQVLQHSFEESTGRLRVDATLSPGGPSEIIISHTDDSIRLGDGTDLVTTTTIGSDVGLDVNILNSSIASTGATTTVAMATANTEYSWAIPIGTKWFEIRSQAKGTLKFGYSSGNRNFDVMPGVSKKISDITTTGALTLYVSSSKNSETLQIHYWS